MKVLTVLVALFVSMACLAQDDAVATAEKKYNAAVEVAKKDFVMTLKAELTRLTKAGDLEGAVKVKNKIASLDGSAKVEVGNMMSAKDCLIGKWNIGTPPWSPMEYEFKDDGTWVAANGSGGAWVVSTTVENKFDMTTNNKRKAGSITVNVKLLTVSGLGGVGGKDELVGKKLVTDGAK